MNAPSDVVSDPWTINRLHWTGSSQCFYGIIDNRY